MNKHDLYRHFVEDPKRSRKAGNVSHDIEFAYSYRMRLAYRSKLNGKDFFIVNGDGSPSVTTSAHQSALRRVLIGLPHCFIPFSVLDNVGINLKTLEIVDRTDDRVVELPPRVRKYKDGTEDTWTPTAHFLGETYFKVPDGTHYVCGLDRNDNPNRRMFYLAELPKMKVYPKTVDDALKALRPADIEEGTPRQGEWFFVPTIYAKPHRIKEEKWRELFKIGKKDKIVVQHVRTTRKDTGRVHTWGSRKDQKILEIQRASIDGRSDSARHWVPELVSIDIERYAKKKGQVTMKPERHIFVRGTVRDDEHDALKLGDGKKWFRVIQNLAPRGWRGGAGNGFRVD